MSDLTRRSNEPARLADLRSRAAARLKGPAAAKGTAAAAADALGVLHALASSPETAADALAMLHELQVHQVELELQAQELRESRAELEAALRRQLELYDHQPAGCFTVDARLAVHELNETGARMLGMARDDAYGLTLEAFLGTEGTRRLRAAMADVDGGAQRPSCVVECSPLGGAARTLQASLAADPAAGPEARRYLVNLAECDAGGAAGDH